jgi:Gas vesicle protein
VLDRVLDKGLVIDAWVRVSVLGLDLITLEARVVVASIDVYLKYAQISPNEIEPRTVLPILKEPVEDWSAMEELHT